MKTESPIKVGLTFLHPRKGQVRVEEHIPTEWGTFSTSVRCSVEGGEDFLEHENVILAVQAGQPLDTFFPVREAKEKKAKKSKLDKSAKYVEELLADESLSNTKRISMLADKCRMTKSTATTYFYKVRKELENAV